MSCYLNDGAATATTFFGSVPQDLSNSQGLLSVSSSKSNSNSNFWLNVLKGAEDADDLAELAE